MRKNSSSPTPDGLVPDSRDMLGRAGALPLAEAQTRLRHALSALPPRRTVEVDLGEALHRVTARAIAAPEDLPPRPRSTVDGFATRAADTFGATESLPVYLPVAGDILMGALPMEEPPPGACVKIATGGYLPPGTDAVVMLEHTVAVDGSLIEVTRPVAAGGNVIDTGDDVRKGEAVVPAGHRLRPQDLGLLAGLGIVRLPVFEVVRVGIVSTGDEIVPCETLPPPGAIRDSNSHMLAALTRECHAEPMRGGIVPDREEAFRPLLREMIEHNDLVCFTGGSSVGSRDLGERLLSEFTPGILVHGVAVKPGKPVILAVAGETPVFGLPGHPVSAAVCFDLFVRPAIETLSGLVPTGLPSHPTVEAILARNLRSAGGRTDFVRVRLERQPNGALVAHPVLGKSGALSTLVKAHGVVEIDSRREGVREGERITVRLLA